MDNRNDMETVPSWNYLVRTERNWPRWLLNLVHNLKPYLFHNHVSIIRLCCLPSGFLLSGVSAKSLHASVISPIHFTCLVQLTVLDFIVLIISGKEWKLRNSSLYIQVSQEECASLRESVPYVKVYRYNPKDLYPKWNRYGDNDQRKVGTSCGSKYCNLHSWCVTRQC